MVKKEQRHRNNFPNAKVKKEQKHRSNFPRSISPVQPRLFKEDYNTFYGDKEDLNHELNELEMIHEQA